MRAAQSFEERSKSELYIWRRILLHVEFLKLIRTFKVNLGVDGLFLSFVLLILMCCYYPNAISWGIQTNFCNFASISAKSVASTSIPCDSHTNLCNICAKFVASIVLTCYNILNLPLVIPRAFEDHTKFWRKVQVRFVNLK